MVELSDTATERALLAACLWDPAAYAAADTLEPGDFASVDNGRIWQAMRILLQRHGGFDRPSIASAVAESGKTLSPDAMASLDGGVPEMAPVYVDRIDRLARARRLASALRGAVTAIEGGEDASEASATIQRALADSCGARDNGMCRVADVAPRVYNEAVGRTGRGSMIGFPTGLRDLDATIHGLIAPDLVVLAGRPAMGKSALASQMALKVAQAGQTVMLFSLEMGRDQLVQRMLSQMADVPLELIRVGGMTETQKATLSTASGELTDLKILIDDRSNTIGQILMGIQRQSLVEVPALVIVDYIQRASGDSRTGNREQEISGISNALKGAAMRHKCCVLALSQLNRGVEARADKRPLMSDLRESGAIEQDADIILFVYREAVYTRKADDAYKAELIIAKHRAGESGKVKSLHWNGPTVSFSDEYYSNRG